MATPKKRYSYTILYTDGTYITYELTRDDMEKIEEQLFADRSFASISIGIIGLKDIRSIIEQKEVEEEQQELEKPLENLPVLDQESYEWLKLYSGGDN